MAESAEQLAGSENAAHSNRVSGLDGLRALAVLLVIIDHFCQSGLLPFYFLYDRWIDLGNIGVRIFFVISGFIITTLLIKEKRTQSGVSIKAFYLRRCFRILPLLAVFLSAIFFSRWILFHEPPIRDILSVALFNVDYMGVRTLDLGHLWSLSVEEKFYLIWPLLFVGCKIKTLRRVLIGVIAIAPVIRGLEVLHGISYMAEVTKFHNAADAIATGCLLSILRNDFGASSRWRAWENSRLVLPTAVILFALACVSIRHSLAFALAGNTLYNVSIGLLVFDVVTPKPSISSRMLNASLTVWLGQISYSLYLWQQPFTLHKASHVRWLASPLLNTVALFILATTTYYLIEKPAREIGRKLAARASSPRRSAEALAES